MDDNTFVYILKDPNTNEVRYVGVTKNPKSRLLVHIRSSKYRPGSPKEEWISGLVFKKQKPIMEVIEICNSANWLERERFWIDFYNQEECNLTNIANGKKPKPNKIGRPSNRDNTNEDLPISKSNLLLDIASLRLSTRAIVYTSDEVIVIFKGSKKWVRIPLNED